MLIPPMMRTENEWTYEPLRQVALVPPVGGRQGRNGRERGRQHQQAFLDDSVELSLDGVFLIVEEELCRAWELFSSN